MKIYAVFTFDDMWLDGLAWHVNYGVPATYFVCPGLVGNDHMASYVISGHFPKEIRLNWDHVRYLRDREGKGCEIGCHGWFHERWDKIDTESAKLFLIHCDDEFGRHGMPRPVSFAFPDHKAGHVTLVKERYKWMRPIPITEYATEYKHGEDRLYLFTWHRSTDLDGLYQVTEGLRAKQAEFITMAEAFEKGLIPADAQPQHDYAGD